ncbi:hypothetical protein COOONC_21481 [Cooperia oncophora]
MEKGRTRLSQTQKWTKTDHEHKPDTEKIVKQLSISGKSVHIEVKNENRLRSYRLFNIPVSIDQAKLDWLGKCKKLQEICQVLKNDSKIVDDSKR